MCDPASEHPKWVCEYCTYENFPSSIKCTMCKGLKPLINEDIFRLSPPQLQNSENISLIESSPNLCLTHTNSNACGPSSNINNDSTNIKWSCHLCTYLNWPRSQRCIQCNTKRQNLLINSTIQANTINTINQNNIGNDLININNSLTPKLLSPSNGHNMSAPIITTDDEYYYNNERNNIITSPKHNKDQQLIDTSNNIQEQIKKLKITDIIGSDPDLVASSNNINNLASSNKQFSISQQQLINNSNNSNCNSPMGSITNLASSRTAIGGAVGNRLSPIENRPYINKWACNLCTYENWPKSLKCSMCGQPKEMNNSSENEQHRGPGFNRFDKENHFINSDICDAMSNNLSNISVNNKHRYQLGSSETINNCDNIQERQERRQRQIRRQVDWQWLNACLGVVENNFSAVEAYLSCGGNPARSLTSNEISILNRNSAFDVGHTLIHLAIRFHREEMLPMLLAQISGSGPGIKRVPSYVAPDIASDIRRHFANSLRIKKSPNCHYVHEHATFALPADIEELPIPIQEQLYDELLDRDAQKQLENTPPALNWSLEITARLGSRLFVLWNRSAGDCLLDSAMQATWGVFDRDNILRRALADSLLQCGHIFYQRWKEYEMFQASMLNFTLEETQWEDDWASLLALASQPGSSLEQLHIFALSHILRRPIIVYGVKYVKSFRGEDIGYARFEGLYLPLLWDQSFCIKSPIALGYTRGHFSALVPMEPYSRIEASRDDTEDVTFLPLMDCETKLLPIHFLNQSEMGREETIMRQWLDVCCTEGGLLVAQQKLRKRPLLVAQMLEEWLNHYRRIAQAISGPYSRRNPTSGYSSDGDTDEE